MCVAIGCSKPAEQADKPAAGSQLAGEVKIDAYCSDYPSCQHSPAYVATQIITRQQDAPCHNVIKAVIKREIQRGIGYIQRGLILQRHHQLHQMGPFGVADQQLGCLDIQYRRPLQNGDSALRPCTYLRPHRFQAGKIRDSLTSKSVQRLRAQRVN